MKSVICLFVLLCPCLLSGQQKFNVSFVLPDSAVSKFTFHYYDCQQRDFLPVPASYNHNKVTISHSYNTVYPVVYVAYGDRGMKMYITGNPAVVKIPGPIDKKAPFKNCQLTNAHNIETNFSAAQDYVKEVEKNYLQLHDSIGAKWQPTDTLDFYKVQDAKIDIDNKRLEYISQHPGDYSSFLLFEKFSIRNLPPDVAMQQFDKLFPATFRNSEQGATMKKYISNRMMVEGQKKAVSFKATDINNNKVILKDIYDKKYVLIAFWGTWCAPCIDEIAVLREIRQLYSKDQLEIVSVAVSSPVDQVKKFIKEEKMDWLHIVDGSAITHLYQVIAYPETYLVDNKGNVIYKYSAYPDLHFGNLKKLLADRLRNL